MAVAIGADTFDLEHIQTLFYLGGRLLDYVGGDIYLDPNGKRFVNEGETLKEISDTVLTLGYPRFGSSRIPNPTKDRISKIE